MSSMAIHVVLLLAAITTGLAAKFNHENLLLREKDGPAQVSNRHSTSNNSSGVPVPPPHGGPGDSTEDSSLLDMRAVVSDDPDPRTLNWSGLNYDGYNARSFLNELDAGTLRQILYLYLSHNNITTLLNFTFPLMMEYTLLELHLDYNPLSPDRTTMFELSRLQTLEILNLSNSSWADGAILESLSLPRLLTLDLSYNLLGSLPALSGLTALVTLDLTGNRLTTLEHRPRLPRTLDHLLLSLNRISWIDHIDHLHLTSLDLSNNSLEQPSHLGQLDVSRERLAGNPWMCSCDFLQLTSSSREIADKESLKCTLDGVEHPWPIADLPKLFQLKCHITSSSWYQSGERVFHYICDAVTSQPYLVWVFFLAAYLLWTLCHQQRIEDRQVPYTLH